MDEYSFIKCGICGESSYRVGIDGSVWSSRVNGYEHLRGPWRRLKGEAHIRGYIRVSLRCSCGLRRVFVHDLVLEAFVGPCPPGMVARHFPDRDTSNNALANLRWGTPQENAADRDVHGTMIRGSRSPFAKLTESMVVDIWRLTNEGHSQKEIAALCGVDHSQVSRVLSGESWSHVDAPGKVFKPRYACKVDASDVDEMRKMSASGVSQTEIGRRFGIDRSQVSRRMRNHHG